MNRMTAGSAKASDASSGGRLEKLLIISCAVIFAITGLAKVYSGFGYAKVLAYPDPVFGFGFRHLLLGVGVLELGVSVLCWFCRNSGLSLVIVAWLSTCLGVYRLGLWWLNWQQPCHCLGTITDAIHIAPDTADAAMRMLLGYMLIGCYGIFVWRHLNGIKLLPCKPRTGGR